MTPGTLLVDPNFTFRDGERAQKILVMLSTSRSVSVVVKTTSRGWRYLNDFGCQAGHRFPSFHLTLGSCCLPKATWVCLDDFYEFKETVLLQKHFAGEVRRIGLLPDQITEDVVTCALHSIDISSHQAEIVSEALERFRAGRAAAAG